jgi:hypothetical protein
MEAINRQSWIRAHTHHLSNAQPNKKKWNSLFLKVCAWWGSIERSMRCCVGVG